MSIDIESLKVFLDTNKLYPKTKLSFEKLELQENNFSIKRKEYNILRNYFHYSKSKPIHIKKSKILDTFWCLLCFWFFVKISFYLPSCSFFIIFYFKF